MGGVPWYALLLMLGAPSLLGLARIVLTITRRLERDPRPGYVDMRRRGL